MYYLSDGHAAANLIKLKVSQEMFIKAATDSAEDDYVTMHTVSKDNSWIPYWMAVETGEKLIKWLLRHCVEAVACSCVLAIADDCTVIDLKEKCAKAAADRPVPWSIYGLGLGLGVRSHFPLPCRFANIWRTSRSH